MLGLRAAARTYGHEVLSFDLAVDGSVQYARWLHPREAGRALEQDVVTELRTFVKPGGVAIDVGAHTGDSTVPMALAVGKAGCVLALEPNPYVFPVLRKNSELNPDKTNIIPLMFAATPADGPVEFEYSDAGFCNGGRHEGVSRWRHGHAFKLRVAGRNLESYIRGDHPDLLPRIRYIKIDAEGYDLEVLKSIRGLVEEVRPWLKVEVFTRSPRGRREALVAFLEGLGYVLRRVVSEHEYRGEPVGTRDVMRWRSFDIFCTPRDRTGPNAAARDQH